MTATATQAAETAQQLVAQANEDILKIKNLGRASASTLQVYQALQARPIATAGGLTGKTGLSPATVNKALVHLGQLGIVRELTAQKRNRLFSHSRFVEIMNQGTELPE